MVCTYYNLVKKTPLLDILVTFNLLSKIMLQQTFLCAFLNYFLTVKEEGIKF